MNFDFYQIIGTKDSKQDNFSSLCSRLIMRIHPEAKPVEGRGGDEGLDTFIGEFNGECHAFQHKYFIDRVGQSQRNQVKKSIETAIKHHKVISWTLLLPIDLTPNELKWFQKLQEKYSPISMDWWGREKLLNLLSEHPDIAEDFSPIVPIQLTVNFVNTSPEEIAKAILQKIRSNTDSLLFKQATLAAVNEIIHRTQLNILLWGSTSATNDVALKRIEIRDRLRKLGYTADLGEDLWTPALKASGLNLSVAELLQAQAYDYIVVFMDSPGVIGEVHDFARIHSLASKMMICVDSCHKNGYSANSVLPIFEGNNGKLHWFERPTDIDQCHLATCVLNQVQRVAEAKQWEITRGGHL